MIDHYRMYLWTHPKYHFWINPKHKYKILYRKIEDKILDPFITYIDYIVWLIIRTVHNITRTIKFYKGVVNGRIYTSSKFWKFCRKLKKYKKSNSKNMPIKNYKLTERKEEKDTGIFMTYEVSTENTFSPGSTKTVQFFKPTKNAWGDKRKGSSIYSSIWLKINGDPVKINGVETYLHSHLEEVKDGELIKNLNSRTKRFVTGYTEENQKSNLSVFQQSLRWILSLNKYFPISTPEYRKKENNTKP